ncbi:MAG TPA: glycerol kinase GlpK [Vicinamibacterales bacterium]|nr:glycerol kinase GlpK [Vicinamibacterales bacterium]
MPSYVGAIDQGTSSTRFIIFDESTRIVAESQQPHEQIYPQAGWVEHDPVEIWRNTQTVIAGALRAGRLQARDLAAIGITNQRETTLVWDRRSGAPLTNALVWQDTRVADYIPSLSSRLGAEFFRSRTGLPLSSYFSSLKIRWILDHVPGARALAEKGDALFGNVDTFLVWQLTGGVHGGLHITDVTNASRTQLLNLDTLAWDDDLLQAFEIPRAMLPAIRSSSERYGVATAAPIQGVPITGILGDQQAALVGQTCFQVGEAKNTYGTGCFLLLNTGGTAVRSRCGLLTTVAYQMGAEAPRYALEGSVAITGALVQWVRDNLALIHSSAEIETLAQTVPDNGGVYFVPAFSGLYAPHWNDGARGAIFGLTRFANRGHVARAVLEATAFQTWEVLQAMEKDSGITLETLRVDGGMTDNELLMQFQADVVNRPVVRPTIKETTALGAAFAAGLAIGIFRDFDDLRSRWGESRRWLPDMNDDVRQQMLRRWTKAVSRSLDWA